MQIFNFANLLSSIISGVYLTFNLSFVYIVYGVTATYKSSYVSSYSSSSISIYSSSSVALANANATPASRHTSSVVSELLLIVLISFSSANTVVVTSVDNIAIARIMKDLYCFILIFLFLSYC